MSKHTIAWMPGDGVGLDVMDAARIVLDALPFEATFIPAELGRSAWNRLGTPLPPETIEILDAVDCALIGAVSITSADDGPAHPGGTTRDQPPAFFDPIPRIRHLKGLHANLRPCRSYDGNPLNVRDDLDLVVFREHPDSAAHELECTTIADSIYDTLHAHVNTDDSNGEPRDHVSITTQITNRDRCNQLMSTAFEYARTHGRSSVTLVERPEAHHASVGLLTRVARDVARRFPEIALLESSIDGICLTLTQAPGACDVLVADQVYGEIVGDLCSGLAGGPGFAASADLGEDFALFRPLLSSTPDRSGQYVANPMAMFAALRLMLDWLGRRELAALLERAIATVIRERRVGTADLGMQDSTLDVAEELARTIRSEVAHR